MRLKTDLNKDKIEREKWELLINYTQDINGNVINRTISSDVADKELKEYTQLMHSFVDFMDKFGEGERDLFPITAKLKIQIEHKYRPRTSGFDD